MPLMGAPTRNRQGTRSGNLRCEHDYPMLVVGADMGYYARYLRYLTAGPERPSGEASRQALRVLGAGTRTQGNS